MGNLPTSHAGADHGNQRRDLSGHLKDTTFAAVAKGVSIAPAFESENDMLFLKAEGRCLGWD